VLTVLLGLILAAAPGLFRLQLATDGRELLPTHHPTVLYDHALREDLGLRDPVAVVLWSTHPEGIFEPAALRVILDLTDRLASPGGVGPERVISLATEPGLRTEPGTLRPKTLLDPLPRTPREIERLRRDLHRLSIYRGVLVSEKCEGATVLVEPEPRADRRRTVAEIRERIGSVPRPGHLRVDVVGAPVAEALLGDHLLADLGVPNRWLVSTASTAAHRGIPLVPAALVFMAGVFLLAFRRPAAALLPLAEVAVCLTVVFGAFGWLGIPVYLTTAVLPIVLTAVGTADEIHVFRRLREMAQRHSTAEATEPADPGSLTRSSWRKVVGETMDGIAGPVTLTSATTAIAFLSFALSPIGPVRVFGLAAAGGVIVCLLITLGALPAMLVVLPPTSLLPGKRGQASSSRVWGRLADRAQHHRHTVLAGAVGLLLIAAGLGLPRLRVQDSWAGGFASHSPMARAIARFEKGFLGSHLLRVVVEGKRWEGRGDVLAQEVEDHRLTVPRASWPGPPESLQGASLLTRVEVEDGGTRQWKTWIDSAEPDGDRLHLHLLRRGGSLRLALRPRPDDRVRFEIVSEPFRRPGPVATVATLEDFLDRQPGVGGVRGPAAYLRTAHDLATGEGRKLPLHPDGLRRDWINYSALRGPERLRETVDPEGWDRAVLTVFQRGSSYRDSGRLLAALERWWAEHPAAEGLSLHIAGDVAISRALIAAVVRTQLQSLALSLLGIGAVVTLLAGSLLGSRAGSRLEVSPGLAALLPPVLAVALAFSAMGILGLPLGVATSMFAGIVLGVGVDGAIHLLARLREARSDGLDVPVALRTALQSVGPAILVDALAVGGGFGLLAFSSVPANAHLGLLLALAVASCLVANLVLLPALWAWAQLPRSARATIDTDGVEDSVEESDSADRGHSGAVVAGPHIAGVGVGAVPRDG